MRMWMPGILAALIWVSLYLAALRLQCWRGERYWRRPASVEQLALAAAALRKAGVAPGAACAGFLWAAKDERRAWKIIPYLWRAGRRI